MGGGSTKQRESFDRKAAQMRADLTREQWNDYQKRYAPWEDKLIKFIDDPATKQAGVDRAKESVWNTYSSGADQYNRNRSRLGESSLGNELEVRELGLGYTKSMAQAVNDSRAYASDRREKVQTSGLGSASTQIRGK